MSLIFVPRMSWLSLQSLREVVTVPMLTACLAARCFSVMLL